MSKIINTVTLYEEHVEVLVEKTGQSSYKGVVLLDIEDLHKVGKMRITASGYAYQTGGKGKSVAHVVMDHDSNMETVVDHINNVRLDNRKKNLRVITQDKNANNRGSSRNNTGVVGISLRTNGNYSYYRATVFDIRRPVKSGKTKSASKRYCKQFNINKLGKEQAFLAAKEWLKMKRKEFGYIDY